MYIPFLIFPNLIEVFFAFPIFFHFDGQLGVNIMM